MSSSALNNDQLYWQNTIKGLEIAAMTSKQPIRHMDYSITLPDYIRKRVERIFRYEYDAQDKRAFLDDASTKSASSTSFETDDEDLSDGDDDDYAARMARDERMQMRLARERRRALAYNESTCSEIERLDNEFNHFDIKLDTPITRAVKEKEQINWASSYLCKQRKERVVWQSKIYHVNLTMWEKTLDEQADTLMNASSERFADWLNSLGSSREDDIAKDQVKVLFAIEGERKLLASIITDPKEVKAIAKTVADKWHLPDMAIELKYGNYLNARWHHRPSKVIRVAFGRTVPMKQRPWFPSESDRPIKTVFPKEILSGQKIFKGIGHLRSVKKFIHFCRRHPEIEKPLYLKETGLFKHKKLSSTMSEMPLYDLLKLKY